MQLENPRYFGERLLSKGFKIWFLYMFKVLEGRDFIVESLHEDLFQYFERLHSGEITRGILNLPPRSGKTCLNQYFIAYSLAINPKCNYIYTSYSQPLLNDISLKIMTILTSDKYKVMYSLDVLEEFEELDAIDEFWINVAEKNSKGKKQTFSAKKWTTPAGGTCLFSSVGSSIVGFGAGVRGSSIFSGGIIIDDGDKPSDIHSQVFREKTHRYYDETLITRLNDSSAFISNIQQRLHLEDLSGYLLEEYEFFLLKKPLINDDGICNLPSQYSDERLVELQKKPYRWSSQYQQEPVLLGGSFGLPVRHTGESSDIHHGICHVDAAFGGTDDTALTILKKIDDDPKYDYIGYGRIWPKHIDDVKGEVYADVKKFLGGTMYFETNADKGYVAKSFNKLGAMVSDYHESQNKHVKIMLYLKETWLKIKWIKETDEKYIKQCLNYTEKDKDDAPDSASSLIRIYEEEYRDFRGLAD